MKVLPYVYPFYPMYNVSTSVVIWTYWGIICPSGLRPSGHYSPICPDHNRCIISIHARHIIYSTPTCTISHWRLYCEIIWYGFLFCQIAGNEKVHFSSNLTLRESFRPFQYNSVEFRLHMLQFYEKTLRPYSVLSIKWTGGNKWTGWAEFFHLLHEKRVQGGAKDIFITWKMRSGWGKNFKIVKRPCSLNRYYRVV